jgi:ferricrocin synthase
MNIMSRTIGMSTPLSILNPQPVLQEGPSLLHDLVAKQSLNNAVAIDFTGQDGHRRTVSYQELHDRADKLAARLRSARRAPPNHQSRRFIVPLLIPQSPELYIAQLGILKAGAAFCPLPLDVPEQRLLFILKDVEAEVLLTTPELRETLPDLDGLSILIIGEDVLEDAVVSSLVDGSPSQAAYIMYGHFTPHLSPG